MPFGIRRHLAHRIRRHAEYGTDKRQEDSNHKSDYRPPARKTRRQRNTKGSAKPAAGKTSSPFQLGDWLRWVTMRVMMESGELMTPTAFD